MPLATKPLPGSKTNECLLCELSNDVEYWDTGRYLDLSFPDKHEGRKYVCRDCIVHGATEFGFTTPEVFALTTQENETLKAEALHAANLQKLVDVVNEAATVIAEGYAGQAAKAEPVVVESKPNKAAVRGAKIVQTVTPEADVTEDGRKPVVNDNPTS